MEKLGVECQGKHEDPDRLTKLADGSRVCPHCGTKVS